MILFRPISSLRTFPPRVPFIFFLFSLYQRWGYESARRSIRVCIVCNDRWLLARIHLRKSDLYWPKGFLFQGHIGENPFDNGSWGKEQFQPSTVPWQLNPRGHARPSVSNLWRTLDVYIYIYTYFVSSSLSECQKINEERRGEEGRGKKRHVEKKEGKKKRKEEKREVG